MNADWLRALATFHVLACVAANKDLIMTYFSATLMKANNTHTVTLPSSYLNYFCYKVSHTYKEFNNSLSGAKFIIHRPGNYYR